MIHVGSCSWTETSLIKSSDFYPKGVNTAEARLRYYADMFDVVEVDSSYYAVPSARTVKQWAERTPPDFRFHIKAYALLTGHSADLRSVPPEVRDLLSNASLKKGRVTLNEKEPLEEVFRLFREALRPLVEAGKVGVVVFQYPPFFVNSSRNLDYIVRCKELMQDFRIGVEFRHGSWLAPGRADSALSFLKENGITYITADEPQYGNLSTVPFVTGVTTGIAYFRLHGRNKANWFKRGGETSLRYDYLYSEGELREFITPFVEAARKAEETFVMFNNCHLGYSMKNARQLSEMLEAGSRSKNTA